MTSVRGTVVLNTIAFVRERYGTLGHGRVLEALPDRHVRTFLRALYEGAWKPLDDVIAYMETARRCLAPQEPFFYRSMGEFAGRRDRESTAFYVMMSDRDRAVRMAPVLWRSYFDSGRLEVAERHGSGAAIRIHDFPARAVLCERILGSLAGRSGDPGLRVEEPACAARGASYCEFRMTWG